MALPTISPAPSTPCLPPVLLTPPPVVSLRPVDGHGCHLCAAPSLVKDQTPNQSQREAMRSEGISEKEVSPSVVKLSQFEVQSCCRLPQYLSSKESACRCRGWKRHRFHPWVGHGNHSGIFAWKIPWTEEPGGVHGVTKSQTQLK